MDEKFKILIASLGDERVKLNESLKYHTFAKLGGPAEYFYIATSQVELIKILDLAMQLKLAFFIFGNGTKLLVPESGIKGLVIKNRSGAVKISGLKGKVGRLGIGVEEALVEVDSGVSLAKLNEFLEKNDLKKILGMSSFSATVGGAIFLDPELRGLTQKVKVWVDGEIEDVESADLKRHDLVVLSVVLKIKAKE